MKTAAWLVAGLVLAGCKPPTAEKQRSEPSAKGAATGETVTASQLRNDDVEWDFNHYGPMPMLSDRAKSVVRREGRTAIPALKELLANPDGYVVAHVVLTNMLTRSWPSFDSWNGLYVNTTAGGKVLYRKADMPALQKQWAIEDFDRLDMIP